MTTPEAVTKTLETALQSDRFDPGRRPEVAFYGGTFTGLPVERMSALLGAVRPFLEKGLFASIRVSTRPDALDRQRLDLMKRCGVSTVELGVQSMSDRVLAASGRGHTVADRVAGRRDPCNAKSSVSRTLWLRLETSARRARGPDVGADS